jgi:hypothetical protein
VGVFGGGRGISFTDQNGVRVNRTTQSPIIWAEHFDLLTTGIFLIFSQCTLFEVHFMRSNFYKKKYHPELY